MSLALSVILTLGLFLPFASPALAAELNAPEEPPVETVEVTTSEEIPAEETEKNSEVEESATPTAPTDDTPDSQAPTTSEEPQTPQPESPQDDTAEPIEEGNVSPTPEDEGETTDEATGAPEAPDEENGDTTSDEVPEDDTQSEVPSERLQDSTVFYLETPEGTKESATLAEAVTAATQQLSSPASTSSVTLWQTKDYTLTATQELSIPAGSTLVIKSAAAEGSPRRTLAHGNGFKTPLFWVKSGTLRLESVIVDGKGVDASTPVASYGSAGLAVVGTTERAQTTARLEAGAGAVLQNGRSTHGYGSGGVTLLGPNASMGMEADSLAQNCTGTYSGFVTLWSLGDARPASFVMAGSSHILSCSSTTYGGAITIAEGERAGQVTLRDSAEISGCTASMSGSAIAVHSTSLASRVRIDDSVRIHDNRVTKSYLAGTTPVDSGNAAAVSLLYSQPALILSGSPSFYNNTSQDNVTNDLFLTGNASGQLRIAGNLSPKGAKDSTGVIWVSASGRSDAKQDFAAAYDADGSSTVPATAYEGYATLRNAIAKNAGTKTDLWGAAGEGTKIVWSSTLTVTFNANGGLVEGSPFKTVNVGSSVGAWTGPSAPADPTPPSDYLIFAGWNTKRDGTGTAYVPGASLKDSTTVYAQWKNNTSVTFSLTYDANGGQFADGSTTQTHTGLAWDEGATPVSPAPAQEPTRSETYQDASGATHPRYTFAGWATEKNAVAANFVPGETCLATTSQTVYAIWDDHIPDPDTESPWRLYVSEKGSDTGRGTRQQPYRTFSKAFEVAAAGTVSQGEGAGGMVPKDPTHPELAWATVVLVGNWQLGKVNAAGTQQVKAGTSVTVRGDTGSEAISVGSTTAANTDLFSLPASTKLVLKRLTIDGKNVSGDHQAIYASGRSDLTLGSGFTLRSWTSTAEPAIQLTGFGSNRSAAFGTLTMQRGSQIRDCTSTGTAGIGPWANAWVASGGALNVNGAATITMKEGSSIAGCSATGGVGGAMFLYGAGTAGYQQAVLLTIDAGASITDCSALTAGGAIYRSNNAIVEIYGSIERCKAGSGGAIGDNDYLAANSQLFPQMSYVRTHPGSYIADCEATGTQGATPIPTQGTGFGGAFGSSTWSNYLLHGGVIENCRAPRGSGGAVGGYAPNVWMKEGQVIRNCEAGYGGALALTEAALFEGGLIENCRATGGATNYPYSNGHGGAIEVSSNENPQVWMDVTIRNCGATKGGGGVSINIADSYDRIYLYGITITGCTAPTGGGFETNNLTGGKSPSLMNLAQLATFNKAYAPFLPGSVRAPFAPIVIEGNTDGKGNPSNLQTSNQNTFSIAGALVEGSSIGVTTGKTTSTINSFNKVGSQFAQDTGKPAGGELSRAFFSDKNPTLVGVYKGTTPVWAQGWTLSYDVNAPADAEDFSAESMPHARRAAITDALSVDALVPEDPSGRYSFAGWSTTPNGKVVYQPKDALGTYEQVKGALDADGDFRATLYAQWERVTVTASFTKVGPTTSGAYTPLVGAQFDVREPAEKDGGEATLVGTFSSDENGTASVPGLAVGTRYELVETAAPNGYALPAGHWTFEVEADGHIDLDSVERVADAHGNLPPAFVERDGQALCVNTPLFSLPNTGGGGALGFVAAGLALLACGGAGVAWRKRRRAHDHV